MGLKFLHLMLYNISRKRVSIMSENHMYICEFTTCGIVFCMNKFQWALYKRETKTF